MSMASKDKMLARVSEWTTLIALAGIAALPLLPGHKTDRASPKVPPRPATRALAPTLAAPAPAATQTKVPAAPAAGASAAAAEDVWTDAQQAAGLRACLRLLAPIAAKVELDVPVKKGPCGMAAPVVLQSVGTTAKVEFHPAPEMSCPLAAHLARWIDTVLQPAAREVLGSRVTRIIGAGSYSCRHMYSNPKLPLSEHATGRAVDIAGFVLADGRKITVAKAWGPTERDIVAAQKKAAKSAMADAKKNDPKTERAGASSAIEKTTAKSTREAKVHKAGLKPGQHARAQVVAAAAGMTAAKTRDSAFLKRLHSGACAMFGTVLGPEANEAHRNHFHFDVKQRKGRGICH